MKNIKTYNFLITLGRHSFIVDINAKSEDEAIDIINESYPLNEGYHYMLIG